MAKKRDEKQREKDGERLKYLLLNAPKENPNIVFNDDYKNEVKELIERIKKSKDDE